MDNRKIKVRIKDTDEVVEVRKVGAEDVEWSALADTLKRQSI